MDEQSAQGIQGSVTQIDTGVPQGEVEGLAKVQILGPYVQDGAWDSAAGPYLSGKALGELD